MSLDVVKGPFDIPPAWQPATVTFIRTKKDLRELGEPRVDGPFAEQAAAWLLEKARGGPQQYWQVDISEHTHPNVSFKVNGLGGHFNFDISLSFNVQVVDARRVLMSNIRSLENYFTPALYRAIADIARHRNIAESARLQDEINNHFGDSGVFSNRVVAALHLTAQVRPDDAETQTDLIKVARVPAKQLALQADVELTRAELLAFERKTGGMTIDALARAAIATGNPGLIKAYNDLNELQVAEDHRNFERLDFLLKNKLIEAADIEHHIGKLGDDIMNRLTARISNVPKGQKQLK